MIANRFLPYPPHDPYMNTNIYEAPALTPVKDNVFQPKHYAQFWPEPVTAINSWGLNFNRGNAVKYIARAGHKNDEVEDLRKAIRYLEIEIECINRRQRVAVGESPMLAWSDTL